jgi:DNA primase
MLEEAERFYHELLCERPEGSVARQCLVEQGLTQSTIKRFRLGYAPPEPDDLLSRQLVTAGYVIPKLLQTVHVNEGGEQKLIDRYGGGHLLIPICDQAGHSWGFMKNKLMSQHTSMQAGWTQDTLSVSERRLRRLIFPHPAWPQDFNRHKTLLIAETPWEVVALHNVGIENVIYLFESATDPVRLRTLLSCGQDFLCSHDPKGYRPTTVFLFMERLEREARHLRVMSLPSKGGLMKLLQSGGSQTIRDAMDHAIPFHQWLGA